ncbi:hypothetical protein KZ820_18280 [Sphingomonas sp. RRHST34]|uniref:Uncharacterized protein n=1 Tax=Sphingomonas citri TaxID=2862499 RepID=A0ABS7BSW7_9SPHN|nr:hypothetical protein [Sphingomonas citri]MBW6532694.1 hypothetical protein [Sphingomonas citri]
MTTYPLSEPATTYANDDDGKPTSRILFKGTLSDCAANVEAMPHNERFSASIKMNALELSYGPDEVDELIRYLRNEDPGLSDKDIADVAQNIE